MHTVRLALQAMATRFELVLHGDNEPRLRAAGEEALEEIRLLEEALSFYRASSEISRINRQASAGPVRTQARVFRVLQTAARVSEGTRGAFDITVAPLMKCWGFVRGGGHWPDKKDLAAARSVTGMHLVALEEDNLTVEFARPGVMLDLGAIGKGYAIEEAARILGACGVEHAFLHGGTSTMAALGAPPGGDAWKAAVPRPEDGAPLAVAPLRNEALSVSAVEGKAFAHKGEIFGHVIDPRTGYPVQGAHLAAVKHASATMCDALSTALLVLGPEEAELIPKMDHRIRSLVAYRKEGGFSVAQTGTKSFDTTFLPNTPSILTL